MALSIFMISRMLVEPNRKLRTSIVCTRRNLNVILPCTWSVQWRGVSVVVELISIMPWGSSVKFKFFKTN